MKSILNGKAIMGYVFLFLAGITVSLILGHSLVALLVSIVAMAFFFLIYLIDLLYLEKDSGVD